MSCHTARKAAIRRNERNPLLRLFQRLPDEQRDSLRFLFRIGGIHDPHTRKASLLRRHRGPALAGLRRQEQAGDGMCTLGRALGHTGAMPLLHLPARHTHAVEQQLEVILRMGDGIPPRKDGSVRFFRSPCAAQFVPHRIVHRQVKIGQDHPALRQSGNDFQQARQRRRRAGYARRDDWGDWRGHPPFARRRVEQHVAPCSRIHLSALSQLRQPILLNHGEKPGIGGPMMRQIGEDIQNLVAPQLFGRDFFYQQAIHRLCDLGSEAQGRCAFSGLLSAMFTHQLRQS